MTKKLIALFLALVTCFGVLAGCKPDVNGIDGAQLEIVVVYQDGVDHNNCYTTKMVETHLGCDLKYLELDDFGTTYVAQLTDGVAPDLTWYSGYTATYEQYGMDGAYINLLDHLDKMPNVKKVLDQHPEMVERYRAADGGLYVLPQVQYGGSAEGLAYLYREDIFAELNLTWPTNQDDFEATLRALKAAYPNSTPFTMRNLTGNIQAAQNWGFLWGASHVGAGNYNTIFMLDENGNYVCAETSLAYKEMGQYLQYLRKEKLLDASSYTHTTQTWTEALASNRAFITYDKVDRLPQLNYAGKAANGDSFQLIAGLPFNMGTHASKTDKVYTAWGNTDGGTGFWFIGNNKNLNATLEYIDWTYSEEGYTMLNWGVKGESYDIDENGKKYFLPSFMSEYGTLLNAGLNYDTLGGNWDYEAFLATADEKLVQSLAVGQAYQRTNPVKQQQLKYNKEERRAWDSYYQAHVAYARAEWLKCVIGQRTWNSFDNLNNELVNKYHQNDLMKIHYSALARAKGGN